MTRYRQILFDYFSDENKNSGDRDAPTLHLRGQQSSLSDYNRNAIITPWAIVEPRKYHAESFTIRDQIMIE